MKEERDRGLGVRRGPPFGRGGSVGSSVIKNHSLEEPYAKEEADMGLGVRRGPPFGRGTSPTSPAIKNHPLDESSE